MKWTEALVVDALREAYVVSEESRAKGGMDEWALLTQVPLRCLTADGEAAQAAGRKVYASHVNERTIDVFLVRCWSGGRGFDRLAVEVKTSKADYRNETDEKRAPAEASAHQCVYAAPAGIIDPATLPPGWGLIEVYETWQDRPSTQSPLGPRARWAKRPARRTPTCDLDYLVTAGFRRASRAEDSIRSGTVPAAEYARMQQEVASLRGIADRASSTARREMQRAKLARSEILALAGSQECADCGEKVTWKRGGTNDSTWSHVNPAHDKPCREVRQEIDRKRREAETGSTYGWGFADPVEPKAIREARKAADIEDTQEIAS